MIIVDTNVIKHLARGNAAAAEAMKRLLASREPVYIATASYDELVLGSPTPELRKGYETLLRDLHIDRPPPSTITDRGDFYANNIGYDPQPGQLGQVTEYGGKDKTRPGDAFVAAETKALRARLWTMDERFAKRAANLGVDLARECAIKGWPGEEDIGVARRLLGLKPASIPRTPTPQRTTVGSGPTTGGSEPPKTGTTTSSGSGGAKGGTGTTTSEVGTPLAPVQEFGPDARGEAKFQGATLAFQGVNFALQKINSAVQARRFEAEWRTRWQPEVQRRLDADPQIGALVLISYAKGPGDSESAIDSVTVFQSIQVGYGLDVDDALRDAQSQQRWAPGRSDVSDRIWLKPKAPPDIKRLPLPFGTTVAGLATFVPGKEKLVRVKFSGVLGFDDKMFSKDQLSVPAGMTPRFYFLWPPDKVGFQQSGGWGTVDISWEMSTEADIAYGDVDAFFMGVPVVSLDSWINPYSGKAAMVWPADNSTANLFLTADATEDNNGLLAGQGIKMMRWVKPEFMRILKAPIG